jgi:hypothetical protein
MGSWMKLLATRYSLLTITVLLLSSCPKKEPPRPKVANPMIDSAEKFTVVYTESVPTQTGLDAFLGILGSKKESLAAEDTTQGPAAGESAAGASAFARRQADTAKSEPARSPDTAKPKESGDGIRVLLVPDTTEPVYNPGTVEMVCLVHHVGIEGGFWGLTGENGQNYDPLNLPDDLKRAGLRVRFWLRMRKDIATTHMWGTPVQIVAYSIPK